MEVAQRLQQCRGHWASWEKGSDQPRATLQSHAKAAKNHSTNSRTKLTAAKPGRRRQRSPSSPKNTHEGELLLF